MNSDEVQEEPSAYAKFIHRYRWQIIIIGLLSLATIIPGSRALSSLDNGGGGVPGSESLMVSSHISEHLGAYPEYSVIVLLSGQSDWTVDHPKFAEAGAAVVSTLRSLNVQGIISRVEYPEQNMLVSADRTKTIIFGSKDPDSIENDKFRSKISQCVLETGITVIVSGSALVSNDISELLVAGLETAEITTIPFVIILLFLTTGGLVSGLVPWTVCISTICWSLAIVMGFHESFKIASSAATVITMFGVGLGIDFSLFVSSRFKSERVTSPDVHVTVILDRVLRTSSRTITFSAITVFLSLCGCFVFNQYGLVSLCLAVMIVSVCTCISANTVLLAVLAALDNLLFVCSFPDPRAYMETYMRPLRKSPSAGNVSRSHQLIEVQESNRDGHVQENSTAAARRVPATKLSSDVDAEGMWYEIGKVVTKYPWPFFAFALSFLGAMCVVCLVMIKFGSVGPDDLPNSMDGRKVYDVVRAQFPDYGRSRLYVFLRTPKGQITSTAFLNSLSDFSSSVQTMDGVTNVRHMMKPGDYAYTNAEWINIYQTTPLPDDVSQFLNPLGLTNFDDSALVHVSLGYGEFSSSSKHTYRNLKAKLDMAFKDSAGQSLLVDSGVTGTPADLDDLYVNLHSTLPGWIVVMLVTIFILLLFMTASVTIPLKATIFGTISLGANLGLLTLIFHQDGPYKSLGINGYFDGPNIIFICALTFSLSVDYEIFLISQIQEIYYEVGDTREAICRALQRSGRLITSAALMLALVTGAFLVSDLIFIKYIGLGVAMAVMLDATIVRMILVPSCLALMGDWCWYCPAPIKRMVDYMGLQEAKQHKATTNDSSLQVKTVGDSV